MTDNEKVPVFRKWSHWYALVIIFLVLLVVLFYFFTKYFA
jgi:Mg2+ and Co2+ transporter CorA